MPPSTAHLFHPKKKPFVARPPPKKDSPDGTSNASGSPSSTPNPASTNTNNLIKPKPRVPRPKPKPKEEDDLKPPAPEGAYSEYRLVSSALNGWKYDVMKFDSRKTVDISVWPQPVKLNRKELRRETDTGVAVAAPQPVGPMLGPDGKPVIGVDGRMVMVDADGKPIRAGDTGTSTSTNGVASPGPSSQGDNKGKEREKASAAKKKFQKKTKQVFIIPEEIRQLRREERYPWVMEDEAKTEVWLGKMEEVSKSETHGMFMPAVGDVFKFVPAHRWYKFQKKPNYHIPNLEEAESLMTQIQKNKDPERWLLRNRNGQAPSDSTVAMFKSERGLSAPPSAGSLVHSAGQSLGPGGRRLKAVDSGGGLFGDDDDEDGGETRRRRERDLGAEGDLEELDFEEDFADDEEKVEADGGEDEEMKEMEERLKRAYKSANKTREGYIDESEEDEDEGPKLSGAGKDMRKLMKKLEKGAYDDSDDEKNPYASSEEEEEEEEPPQVPTGPAIQPHEPRPSARSTSQGPGAGTKTPTPSQSPPGGKKDSGSRATSPAAPTGHGGHSIVAKRATSPKALKLKGSASSRAGSPLAPSSSGSRATSPVASSGSGVRAESPPQGSGLPLRPSNKRKATDEPTSPTQVSGESVKAKKRKAQPGEPAVSGELGEPMLIEWLRNTPGATTRDCIQYFTPWLKTEEKKQNFTRLVKEVATLKNGVLVLRNAYRNAAGSGGAPATMG